MCVCGGGVVPVRGGFACESAIFVSKHGVNFAVMK